MVRLSVTLVAALLVASCQTVGPTWSELSGARYHRAVLNRLGVIVVAVDGESTPIRVPIRIDPGQHEITVQSLPHGQFRAGYEERLTVDVQPCRRYYINAQYPDPLQPGYTPVIDEVEPIPGCRTGL